jgi:hypothetical protein
MEQKVVASEEKQGGEEKVNQ